MALKYEVEVKEALAKIEQLTQKYDKLSKSHKTLQREVVKLTTAQEKAVAANTSLSLSLSKIAADTKAYNALLITHSAAVTKTYTQTNLLAAASLNYQKTIKAATIAKNAEKAATAGINAEFARSITLEAEILLLKSAGMNTLLAENTAREVSLAIARADNASKAQEAVALGTLAGARTNYTADTLAGVAVGKELLGVNIALSSQGRRDLAVINSKTAARSKANAVLSVTYLEAQRVYAAQELLAASNAKLSATTASAAATQSTLRSAFRGTAGALGGLWLAYGEILPMMAAFAGAMFLKDIVQLGAAFQYATTFIVTIGEVSGSASMSVRGLQAELVSMEGLRRGPQELAAGMREFAKAGVSAEEGLKNIAELARFATIAEIDLASATALVIGQANAFGVSYADAANMITGAAMNSATSITEMAQAMSQTTELGSVAKLKFEEVAAALAVMANAGVRGSKAGTSVRTSILRLQSPTSKLTGMLEALGITFTAFDSNGNARGMLEMFQELDVKLNQLTDADRVKVIREMFGLRAMKGGANLIRMANEGLADMIEKVKDAAEGTTALQEAADGLDDTTVAKWERLGVTYEKLILGIKSSAVTDFVIDVTDSINQALVFMASPIDSMITLGDQMIDSVQRMASVFDTTSFPEMDFGDGLVETFDFANNTEFIDSLTKTRQAIRGAFTPDGDLLVPMKELVDTTIVNLNLISEADIEFFPAGLTTIGKGMAAVSDQFMAEAEVVGARYKAVWDGNFAHWEENKEDYVKAAQGLTDNWLEHIDEKSAAETRAIETEFDRLDEATEYKAKIAKESIDILIEELSARDELEEAAKEKRLDLQAQFGEEITAVDTKMWEDRVTAEEKITEAAAERRLTRGVQQGKEIEKVFTDSWNIRVKREEDAAKKAAKRKLDIELQNAKEIEKVFTDSWNIRVKREEDAAKKAADRSVAVEEWKATEIERVFTEMWEDANKQRQDDLDAQEKAAADAISLAKDKADALAEIGSILTNDNAQEHFDYERDLLVKKYAEWERLLKLSQEEQLAMTAAFNVELGDLDDARLLKTGDLFDGIRLGYEQLIKDQLTWAEAGKDIFLTFADESADAVSTNLFKVMKGDFEDLGDAWADLWDSMLQKLADVAAEMAVTWAASQVSNYFQGWKFHDGAWSLEDDEVPAILQHGEMVIPATHAAQIRDNMMGMGNGGSGSFEGLVDATRLSTPEGWDDDFSDHFGDLYSMDLAQAIGSIAASGDPLAGLLGLISPMNAISNTNTALGLSGLDAMGITGGWGSGGFTVGSFATMMALGSLGPLGAVAGLAGLSSLGGVLGGFIGDAVGGFFNLREFEEVRHALKESGMSNTDIKDHVDGLGRIQDMFGSSIAEKLSIRGTTKMLGTIVGPEENLGLNELMANQQAEAKREREKAFKEEYEDIFGEEFGNYGITPGERPGGWGNYGSEGNEHSGLDDGGFSPGGVNDPGEGYFASGGLLQGGSGTRDDLYLGTINGVNQVAMGGEYIVNAKSTAANLPLLESINSKKYAEGGSVSSSYTSSSDIFKDHQTIDWITANQNDYDQIGNVFELIKDAAEVVRGSNLTDYAASLYEVNTEYDRQIALLKVVGASLTDIAIVEQARALTLEELATAQRESIDAILAPSIELFANKGLSDLQIALVDIDQEYNEQIETLVKLGAAAADLTLVENARLDAMIAAEDANRQSIDDILAPSIKLFAEKGFAPLELALIKIDQEYNEQIETLVKLGAAAADLTLIENARLDAMIAAEDANRANIADIIAPSIKLFAEKGFTPLELALIKIDQKYNAQIETLVELGAAAADLTLVESARFDAMIAAEDEAKSAAAKLVAELKKLADAETAAAHATALAAAKANVATARSDLQNAFSAEADRLKTQHNTAVDLINEEHDSEVNRLNIRHGIAINNSEKQLDAISDFVSNLESALGSLTSAKESLELSGSSDGANLLRAQNELASFLEAARSGTMPDAAALSKTLSVLTGDNKEVYVDSVSYQRDFWKTYLAIAELEALTSTQLSTSEKMLENLEDTLELTIEHNDNLINQLTSTRDETIFQMELDLDTKLLAMDAQLNALLGIDTSVMSVSQAIINLAAAVSALELIAPTPEPEPEPAPVITISGKVSPLVDTSGIAPSGFTLGTNANFAVGSNSIPYDMLASVHKGEEITPARYVDTQREERQESTRVIKNMAKEIKELRGEMKAQQTANIKANQKTANLIEKWDYDGMPVETV